MIIHNVEQGSQEWHDLHVGIPTSYQFSKLVTPTGKLSTSINGFAMDLASELYLGRSVDGFTGNAHTDRGTELEPEAISEYCLNTGNEIKEVGFITNDEKTWGCSTDGLVVDQPGAIEAKCLSDKNHAQLLIEYRSTGKKPDKYFPQVQGEIFVAELEWVDMIFYHPEFDGIVFRVEPDWVYQENLKKQLEKVIALRDKNYKLLTGELSE